jgi:hypothetical protein
MKPGESASTCALSVWVAADSDADTVASRHLLGSVVDRAGPVERRRLSPDAPSRDIDGRAALAKNNRNALAAVSSVMSRLPWWKSSRHRAG